MRKFYLILTAFLFIFAPRLPAYAETSQVAIELQASDDGFTGYYPGTDVNYALALDNKLGPSWVRAKIDIAKTNIEFPFSDQNLHIQSDWVKHGDYYYYERKAPERTVIPIVDGFTLPDTDHVKRGASITLTVDADAVQYSAFAPDFSKAEPWEGAEVSHSATYSSRSSFGGSGAKSASSIHIYASPKPLGGSGTPGTAVTAGISGTESTGDWILLDAEKHEWSFSNGNVKASGGWVYTENPYSTVKGTHDWFHFDENGIMTHGWLQTENNLWYYTHDVNDGDFGRLEYGWHTDSQDGRTYYLDPQTGIMLTGWQEIDGAWYYFATLSDVPNQSWFWNTGFGKWVYNVLNYRTYGSMYCNETTPDGHFVDGTGRRADHAS